MHGFIITKARKEDAVNPVLTLTVSARKWHVTSARNSLGKQVLPLT